MIASVDVLRGRYYDSVRLMQVTRDVGAVAGVVNVLVAMATDLNQRLLADMGFDATLAARAGPDDLLVAVRTVDPAAAEAAQAAVQTGLSGGAAVGAAGLFVPPAPRTIGRAVRSSGTNLALISVPGPNAFVEALEAVRSGVHVMVFSDNVPIEHEVILKTEASLRDVLVMGPDCGTAIVAGVGLGFANAVSPGPVGIAGASGTGIQQLCCLLDWAGVGVRHALGTGSRDLSATVGGISTLQALAALDADPAVEVIVILSKPPDPEVAATVERAVTGVTTPVVTAMLGTANITLEAAAAQVLATLGSEVPVRPAWMPDAPVKPRGGALVGCFSGGTLRDEALAIATPALGPIAADPRASGHRLVDYGADEFTQGRAHPMIDAGLRLDGIAAAVGESATGVILLDVVLGYGAHSDPSADLAPAVHAATQSGVPVVVSMCGTTRDPQGIDRQVQTLCAAGAEVYVSNAAAARRAIKLVPETAP